MKTLRSKMILLILIPAAAIAVITAFMLYFQIKTEATATTEEMLLETVDGHAKFLGEWIHGIIREAKTFAEEEEVIEALKTREWKGLMEDLKQELAERPDYEMFFIAYPDGLAATTFGSTTNVSDREYFQKIMKQGAEYVVSDGLISKVTGRGILLLQCL